MTALRAVLVLCSWWAWGSAARPAPGATGGEASSRVDVGVAAAGPSGLAAGQHVADGDEEGGRGALLAPARFAALPQAERVAWSRYVELSRRTDAEQRQLMDAELRQAGRTAMRPAPSAKAFRFGPEMTEAWFRTPEARRIADHMLTFQTPAGGWSKRVEMTLHPRAPGESYASENGGGWASSVATLDDDSTTDQIRFMAAAYAAHGDQRYREAVVRGIDYLLQAQFPNGCWPQGYPLQGGYHDAITFNDNVMVNVLRLLADAAGGRVSLVTLSQRHRAAQALAAGVQCVLRCQVTVAGTPTVWAQQHDPLTLAPVPGRPYELAGLAARESAAVTSFLMTLPFPDRRVVDAVNAAVSWFESHQLMGHTYDHQILKAVPGAGPLWARLTEVETGRPIFSNRDGVKLYDWERLTDLRQGYSWFGNEPAETLRAHSRWGPNLTDGPARPSRMTTPAGEVPAPPQRP